MKKCFRSKQRHRRVQPSVKYHMSICQIDVHPLSVLWPASRSKRLQGQCRPPPPECRQPVPQQLLQQILKDQGRKQTTASQYAGRERESARRRDAASVLSQRGKRERGTGRNVRRVTSRTNCNSDTEARQSGGGREGERREGERRERAGYMIF